MEKIIFDKIVLLKKYPGKGGWTYAEIDTVSPDKTNPFGWVKVKGFIDDYSINQYKLMLMGGGNLFLPIKADIRKIIGKQAGDKVHVILYLDKDPLIIPQEIMDCFEIEDEIFLSRFKNLKEGKQKTYLDWIYKAKTEKTKVDRILKLIEDMKDMI